MKNKIKSLFLMLSIIISLFILMGCEENNQSNNSQSNSTKTITTVKDSTALNKDRIMPDGTYQIRFSDLVSVESLKEYDNKTVTAVGYLSPVMGIDSSFGYLMNLPYQTCPYCVPGDTKITNTMAIFAKDGKKIDFTEAAVLVKGTLKLEEHTDDYGYSYGYRMVDVTVELADTSSFGSKLALYNKLAEKEILTGIMDTLYAVDNNIYYDTYIEYGESYERAVVDVTAIDGVIENLKGFDQTEVETLVTIANDLKELTVTTNKLVETKEFAKLADYQAQIDNLFNSINEWMGEYQL